MALQTFNQNYYLANNPDVMTAVLNGVFSAEDHYVIFGEREGRKPSQFFDSAGYLSSNPDVFAAVQAGVFTTGLQHFEMFGAAENRTPGNIPFNEEFYLAQNPDVAAAVEAGTFGSGYAHYVLFGAAEGRSPADGVAPGIDGDVFTLTTAAFETLNGTSNDDQFNGIMGDDIFVQKSTFNTGDTLNGSTGNDTFNLFLEDDLDFNSPAGSGVSAVEVNNLISDGPSTFTTDGEDIEADYFDGATQIWQVNMETAEGVVNVGSGVTVGFRQGDATVTVEAARAADSLSIALDQVDVGVTVSADEARANDVKTVSVSGSVASDGAFNLDASALGDLETVNFAISSDSDLSGSDFGTATMVDASGSTGDLTLAAGAVVETLLGGSGEDTITTGAATASVTGGAGADDVTLTGGAEEEVVINAGDTGLTLASADLYTGFVAGEDSFNFGLDAGSDTTFLDGGLSSSFTDGLTNANTAFASNDDLLYFLTNDGTDTYLFVDRDAGGSTDEGVVLAGVVALTQDDIVA